MDVDRETVKHQSDEALESQIVSARAALRHDLMLLEEKVTPSAIIDRRKRRMQYQIGEWRRAALDRVMELRQEATELTQDMGQSIEGATEGAITAMEETMSETTSKLAGTRSKLAETTSRATEIPGRAAMGIRNSSYSRPLLFAGLAFLAGWGISRVMPMTRPEEELASRVAPVVGEKAGPIVDEAKTAVAESTREAMSHRDV